LVAATLLNSGRNSAALRSAFRARSAKREHIPLFWPAAFLVGGDKQTAAELAQMKGQMNAIEQASIAKKCNIQFQQKQ
jgi:hypothetical protein